MTDFIQVSAASELLRIQAHGHGGAANVIVEGSN